MAKIWKARETKVLIANASDVTIDTSDTLYNAIDSATSNFQFEGLLKNVTISEPEGAADKVDLLGVDANNFQNAELDLKPYGVATISGTLVHQSQYAANALLEEWTGSATTVSTSYHRYQVGNGSRTPCTIVVQLSDDTYEVNIALDNAIITKLGDRKISGADGHWEQDFEAVCLPRDFYIEYKE